MLVKIIKNVKITTQTRIPVLTRTPSNCDFHALCGGMQHGAAAVESSILVLCVIKLVISISRNNLLRDVHPRENRSAYANVHSSYFTVAQSCSQP